MQLKELSISGLRNLYSVDLTLNSQFNFFWGKNGGGKTSLLEAVHILATGRSFRARLPRQIITFGEPSCTVSGLVSPLDEYSLSGTTRLGVERTQSGGIKMRLAEQDCHSIATLAQILPLQLINSDIYDILEATPQCRRQFLDWAMFHVEHSFYEVWRRFKRALQQRNAALREAKHLPNSSIRVWDKELIQAGAVIDLQREALLLELTPLFSEVVKTLLDLDKEIIIQYQRGWNDEQSLEEALDRSFERDRLLGYTTIGPHRADLGFLLGQVPAKNYLSRGQTKLYICALLIARAKLLFDRHGRRSVFLIDDLCSELDSDSSRVLVAALSELGCQVLVTSIEGKALAKLLENQECATFQVNKGQIMAE